MPYKCPIWDQACPAECWMKRDNIPEDLSRPAPDMSAITCRRAGSFSYQAFNPLKALTAKLDEDTKLRLCGEIAHQNLVYQIVPQLNENLMDRVKSQPMPLMPKRLDLALTWLVLHSPKINDYPLGDEESVWSFLAFSHCQGEPMPELTSGEANGILRALCQEGLVEYFPENTRASHRLVVTHKGYARYEELQRKSVDSSQAFVAMWFEEEMKEVYNKAIAPAIEEAGYKPVRIDHVPHNRKIDDEIIAQIRQSRFVVADFTAEKPKEPRGGVYYEAGFAYGFGREVIFTCRRNFVDELHFDTRQYNHILWDNDNLLDFREQLRNRIEATIGRGPIVKDEK